MFKSKLKIVRDYLLCIFFFSWSVFFFFLNESTFPKQNSFSFFLLSLLWLTKHGAFNRLVKKTKKNLTFFESPKKRSDVQIFLFKFFLFFFRDSEKRITRAGWRSGGLPSFIFRISESSEPSIIGSGTAVWVKRSDLLPRRKGTEPLLVKGRRNSWIKTQKKKKIGYPSTLVQLPSV